MIFLYITPVIVVLAILVLLISKGTITMNTRSSVVDESKYLRNSKSDNPSPTSANNLIHPFNLQIDPMEKLILFDIEDDPLYTTLEIQEFDDTTSKGLVILVYRQDKEIDVYHTSGITHDFYKGSPKGAVKEISPVEYFFERSEDTFRFCIRFKDKEGNEIFVKAHEKNPNKKHFSILAPAGDMIDNFTSFPLFFMKETAFLEKDHAEIQIRIAGEERKPVAIPIAINGKFVYLSRYCLEPVVASFNENYRGKLEPSGDETTVYDALCELPCSHLGHNVTLRFSPPFPNLASTAEGLSIKGRFSASVDSHRGILAGDYSLFRNEDRIAISLSPKKGWQPMPGKKWFKQYKWESTVTIQKDGLTAESQWVKG